MAMSNTPPKYVALPNAHGATESLQTTAPPPTTIASESLHHDDDLHLLAILATTTTTTTTSESLSASLPWRCQIHHQNTALQNAKCSWPIAIESLQTTADNSE